MERIKLEKNGWFGKLRYAFVFFSEDNSFGCKKEREEEAITDTLVGCLLVKVFSVCFVMKM